MSEHTKGEIRVSSSNPESIYVLKDGQADGLFAMCDAGDYARSQEEGYANAKELVRRWNAFEEDGLVADLLEACKDFSTPLWFSEFATFAEVCSLKPNMAVYKQRFIQLATFLRSCVDKAEKIKAVIAEAAIEKEKE